jgi:hypothetical protein
MSETKIQLNRMETAAVASSNEIEKRIQDEANNFKVRVQKRIKKKTERFNRESVNNMTRLYTALAESLGMAKIPDGSLAWVRPDGVGELVIPGPDPREIAKQEKAKAEAEAAAKKLEEEAAIKAAAQVDERVARSLAPITPMPTPVGVNGDGHDH